MSSSVIGQREVKPSLVACDWLLATSLSASRLRSPERLVSLSGSRVSYISCFGRIKTGSNVRFEGKGVPDGGRWIFTDFFTHTFLLRTGHFCYDLALILGMFTVQPQRFL